METISENCHIAEGELIEVDFAKIFQEAIISSKLLNFKEESLKKKILDTDGKQLLVVSSTIDSPKVIQSVVNYDEDFIEKSL